jgi:hypothetical protein
MTLRRRSTTPRSTASPSGSSAATSSACPAYAAYCRAAVGTRSTWTTGSRSPRCPPPPSRSWSSGRRAETERVFRTSGTTRGPERRGAHHVADLSCTAHPCAPPSGRSSWPTTRVCSCFSLMPPPVTPGLLPGVHDQRRAWTVRRGPGARTFADGDGSTSTGWTPPGIGRHRRWAAVLLLGTSAAFIHWLDRLAAGGSLTNCRRARASWTPAGTRGRPRADPAALRQLYRERLGLPPTAASTSTA